MKLGKNHNSTQKRKKGNMPTLIQMINILLNLFIFEKLFKKSKIKSKTCERLTFPKKKSW